jgi:hypothetical protein
MIELMETVRLDLGAGFHKTMMESVYGPERHFTLAYLLGG